METDASTCPICYEEFPSTKLDRESNASNTAECITSVQGCNHSFCRDCLVKHCMHAILSRDIPIQCPARQSASCKTNLCELQVQNLLVKSEMEESLKTDDKSIEAETLISYWNQFQRLQTLRANPTLINCPKCDELVSTQETILEKDGHKNDLICPNMSCKHQFCALHGDAHPGKSCKDFRPDNLTKWERQLKRTTKPCSHCGISIYKERGCDHIVCGRCNKDMCFRCGSHEYLSGEMMRSCHKCDQHFIDHRYVWSVRLLLCLGYIFYIPLCLLYIVISMFITTLSCFCCGCLFCGYILDNESEEGNTVDGDAHQGMKSHLRPIAGLKASIALIFLPCLDLTDQWGIRCCITTDDLPKVSSSELDV